MEFALDASKIEVLTKEAREMHSILSEIIAESDQPKLEPSSKITHKINAANSLQQPGKGQGGHVGEKIPHPTSSKFALDATRIEALTKETHEMHLILSGIMAEPEPSVSAKGQEFRVGQESVAWLSELDTRYHTALLTMINHDSMSAEDFEALAATQHLISEDLFNTINSWSDDSLGDFLLEKSEDILIRKELLPNTPVLIADHQYGN